jgi:hypothetical protein
MIIKNLPIILFFTITHKVIVLSGFVYYVLNDFVFFVQFPFLCLQVKRMHTVYHLFQLVFNLWHLYQHYDLHRLHIRNLVIKYSRHFCIRTHPVRWTFFVVYERVRVHISFIIQFRTLITNHKISSNLITYKKP